jgi:hypothetical protein
MQSKAFPQIPTTIAYGLVASLEARPDLCFLAPGMGLEDPQEPPMAAIAQSRRSIVRAEQVAMRLRLSQQTEVCIADHWHSAQRLRPAASLGRVALRSSGFHTASFMKRSDRSYRIPGANRTSPRAYLYGWCTGASFPRGLDSSPHSVSDPQCKCNK